MLKFLADSVACEDVNDAHEVDVLLVAAEQTALKLLIEAHVLLCEAIHAHVHPIERIQRRLVIFRRCPCSIVLHLDVSETVTPRHESARVLGLIVDADKKRVVDDVVVGEELGVLAQDLKDLLPILVPHFEHLFLVQEVIVFQ